jgi:3-oxoacyl-[acyl-carrier protein] reductase
MTGNVRDEINFEVQGRTVIVTGGSRGVGYGIVEVFADAGAHANMVGRDSDVVSQAATRLADRGASVDCAIADITKPSERSRMTDEVMATRDDVDVLCFNAGIVTGRKLVDMAGQSGARILAN